MSRFAGEPLLAFVACGPLALGVAAGSAAAALELHGLLHLPRRDPTQRAAFWVLLAEVVALGLFSASLWVRIQEMDTGLAVELCLIGFVIAMLTGVTRDLLGLRADRPAPAARGRPVWSRRLNQPLPPEG